MIEKHIKYRKSTPSEIAAGAKEMTVVSDIDTSVPDPPEEKKQTIEETKKMTEQEKSELVSLLISEIRRQL